MGRVTVFDLAAEAGVSLATVDRVLNRRPGVARPTIERVEAAMRRLDYTRDISAANLAKKRTYPILCIVPLGTNTFMRNLEAEIRALAKHAEAERVQITVQLVPPFDTAALTAALKAVDPERHIGVVVVATDAQEIRVALDDLAARGIHVVTLVSDVPASRRTHYAGIDNTAAGRTAGSLIGRFLPRRPGKVGIVAGSMLLRDHVERRMGFEQIIRTAFTHLEVLPPIEGRDESQIVEACLGKVLAETPDLVGVYSLGAGNRGVIAALHKAGRARDVVVVAHELTDHARRALVDETFDAVINQDAGHEIRSAIRVITARADGREVIPGQERIRIDVFLKENLP
jgi:LacI family transcriptional regulator